MTIAFHRRSRNAQIDVARVGPRGVVLEDGRLVAANAKMVDSGNSNIAAVRDKIKAELDTALDAVRTIESCSAHQKRIIDDILTLSKLDAKLLSSKSPCYYSSSRLLTHQQ